jgi:hypothetical protein
MDCIRRISTGAAAFGVMLATGCGDDGGAGAVQVFTEPEDSIPEGLEPGDGEENIADGWAVSYERFLITIGNVRAARSDASETLADPAVYVLDLRNAPAGGYIIAELAEVSAVRWDRFGFDLPNAAAGARALAPTADADAAFMIDAGYSIYFEGTISKADGESCPPGGGACAPAPEIGFAWGFSAGTSFDDCATEDGEPGFAVPSGGTVQVKPTIHGDHWFFSSITAGEEITKRYAQYIADADLDQDGETTLDELRMVQASDVFPSPQYNLAGALGGPVNTAFDYVLAQARTLGDYQGDGECPTRRLLP